MERGETIVMANQRLYLKFHPPSPALEWRIRLSLTWPRRTQLLTHFDWSLSCCGGRILEYQEFHLGVFSFRELGWLCSAHSRREDFRGAQKTQALSMLSAEAGAEGEQCMTTLRGAFYFCRQAIYSLSSLPPRAALLPALGPWVIVWL